MSNADIGKIASLLKRESKQREPISSKILKGQKCSIEGFHRCQTPTAVKLYSLYYKSPVSNSDTGESFCYSAISFVPIPAM